MKYMLIAIVTAMLLVGCEKDKPSYCSTAETVANVISPIFMLSMGCDLSATSNMILDAVSKGECVDNSNILSITKSRANSLNPVITTLCRTAINSIKTIGSSKLIGVAKCDATMVNEMFALADTEQMCGYLITKSAK